jgi:hypothetical protein
VKEYVRKSVEQGTRLSLDDFLSEKFQQDEGRTKEILIRRTGDIVSSLHEGNHVAYGVGRKTFDTYDKGCSTYGYALTRGFSIRSTAGAGQDARRRGGGSNGRCPSSMVREALTAAKPD